VWLGDLQRMFVSLLDRVGKYFVILLVFFLFFLQFVMDCLFLGQGDFVEMRASLMGGLMDNTALLTTRRFCFRRDGRQSSESHKSASLIPKRIDEDGSDEEADDEAKGDLEELLADLKAGSEGVRRVGSISKVEQAAVSET